MNKHLRTCALLVAVAVISITGAYCKSGDIFAARNSATGVDVFRVNKDGVAMTSGFAPAYRGVTASAAAAKTDVTIGVRSTASARTITLPASTAFVPGQQLVVKDESGGANTHNITVAAAGSDTINGAASVAISTAYGSTRVYSDGAGHWFTF